MYKLAILSMHGCPVTLLGSKEGGGMNVYILQVAKKLGELGIKVDVYTRRHDPNDPQIVDLGNSKNARVIHIDAGPYKKTKDRLYGYIPEFVRRLEEFRKSNNIYYDLLHSKINGVVSCVYSTHTTYKYILQILYRFSLFFVPFKNISVLSSLPQLKLHTIILLFYKDRH